MLLLEEQQQGGHRRHPGGSVFNPCGRQQSGIIDLCDITKVHIVWTEKGYGFIETQHYKIILEIIVENLAQY